MAKNEAERVTEEKVAKGGILVKMYFDMQSEEKDKLQPLLVELINERLLKEPGVVYCFGSVEEPILRDKLYVTSATMTVLFENFKSLILTTFKYAPVGVEVLKPQKELHINVWDLQPFLLDLSQLSIDYSRYMLEKILKKEDFDVINKQMENRKDMGKNLIDKSKKEDKK